MRSQRMKQGRNAHAATKRACRLDNSVPDLNCKTRERESLMSVTNGRTDDKDSENGRGLNRQVNKRTPRRRPKKPAKLTR